MIEFRLELFQSSGSHPAGIAVHPGRSKQTSTGHVSPPGGSICSDAGSMPPGGKVFATVARLCGGIGPASPISFAGPVLRRT